MPLIESGSDEAREKNIDTLIEEGKDPKQASAIAYEIQRKHKNEGVRNMRQEKLTRGIDRYGSKDNAEKCACCDKELGAHPFEKDGKEFCCEKCAVKYFGGY